MPSLQIEQATVMGLPALIPVVQPVEALTKNVMETHEMVNDELGGRRFGLPYLAVSVGAIAVGSAA